MWLASSIGKFEGSLTRRLAREEWIAQRDMSSESATVKLVIGDDDGRNDIGGQPLPSGSLEEHWQWYCGDDSCDTVVVVHPYIDDL